MADWGQRFVASYRFMRVSRATGAEVARLDNVEAGGSVERNQDCRYETGSVDFMGELDLGSDLVRVYLDATFDDGTTVSEPLGTFLVEVPKRSKKGTLATGTADLSGRLAEVAEDEFEAPVTVAAGTNAVAAAAALFEEAGLEVLADESDYTLSAAWVLGATGTGDSQLSTRLGAANALLNAAGFSAAQCDAMGRVTLRRYAEPEDRAASLELVEGPAARFENECTDERDAHDVANVVICHYSTQEESVTGVAVDSDPSSPYSTVSRGWRKCASYTYDDLPAGGTDAARKANADAKALELLRTNQAVIRRVTVTHAYAPLQPGDAVSVDWPSAGISGKFAVRRMSLDLLGGCPMELELKRYER